MQTHLLAFRGLSSSKQVEVMHECCKRSPRLCQGYCLVWLRGW